MINIPVATINDRSPYLVQLLEHNSFVFNTRYGITYNVGFTKDTILYEDAEIYHFFIINKEHSHFFHDPLLYKTIESIIITFFEQDSCVLLYLCDALDGRQAIRNRLFRAWFDRYPENHFYSFINRVISYDNVDYYGAIILKKSHPNYDEIIERFISYTEELIDMKGG